MSDPDPDFCDEMAMMLLGYDSMKETLKSREYHEGISGYLYKGKFGDENDLVIGPDYSYLLGNSEMGMNIVEAYYCGFRTRK